MDFPNIIRLVDGLNHRLRKVENALNEQGPADAPSDTFDLYNTRQNTDIESAEISSEFVSGSPLLASL